MSNNPKIIFVAFNDNSLARRIIKLFIDNNIIPIQAFMASENALKAFRKNGIRRYYKQNGLTNTIWRIFYRLTLRKELKNESLNSEDFLKTPLKDVLTTNNIPIDYFDNINHPEFVSKMKELSPDIIVLAGAPLIKHEVIDLPKIAVLNSHPAILPEGKGMDVVAHSLLNKIPLGATVFKVDAGIDSGPIILKKYLEHKVEGQKLYQLESMVEALSAQAMLDAVLLIKSGNYSFEPQENKGQIFRSLGYGSYNKVRKLLRNIK